MTGALPKIQQPFYEPFIARHFPSWAVQRERSRVERWAIEASFKGGVPTRTTELYSESMGYPFGSSLDRSQILKARDRGYQAYKANPIAKALLDTETDNVIGDGLNYQPTSSSEAWNREAIDRYYEWLDECSVRGPDIHSGVEIPRLLWNRSRAAGDVAWVLVSRFVNGRPESLIQIVPGEDISTPDELRGLEFGRPEGRRVYDGIEFDRWSRPVNFFVKSQDEVGNRGWATIPARDIVFLPHYEGEAKLGRGVTAFMTAFEILSHLDKYIDGVALAAWMATVFGIVFKQANAAQQLNLLGTAYNSAGTLQKALTLENGMIKYIGTDDEVAQVQASQPMHQTPDFIRAMLRLAGMVFGMPLEAFARDMSTCNFASARIGLLPFYRLCRIRGQGTFGPRWSRTIRWWLSREALRADDDPKKWKVPFPRDIRDYWSHELQSNAWEYTDPVSEVQGDMLQVDAGFKSRKMVVNERGRDKKQIDRDRAEDTDAPKIHSTMTRDAVDPEAKPSEDEKRRELQEKVALKFLDDKTVNDVIYNVTDIPGLLTNVGIPLDPTVNVAKGDGVPFLPVIAQPGPLVTGDTIQDPEGGLVGGDVEVVAPPDDEDEDEEEDDDDDDANTTE